jgi:glycerol kinase
MWLCIDQGGHSTRVAAFDHTGELAAQSAATLDILRPGELRVEHDPEQLIASLDRCLRDVGGQLGPRCAQLRGAAIATQRSTLVCASKSSAKPLSPVISWQDRRGHAELNEFSDHAERIKHITGLRLTPHYGVGKLRWCMKNLDAVMQHAAAGDLMGAPLSSYILRRLTRDDGWRVDPVNASRTLLLDARTLCWSDELIGLFGIRRDALPAVQPCRSNFGTIELGRRRVPVTVATGDQAAAMYCAGEPARGTAFINIGTGAFIQALTGDALVEDPALLSSIVWYDGAVRRYVLEGTVNGAASALDAVAAELGVNSGADDGPVRAALGGMRAAPLFLNGISGLGSPDWIADFETRFEGGGDSGQRMAAVYESIAFLIHRNLERMQRLMDLKRVFVTGGLAHADWLPQAIADLCGLPVARPAETEATTAGLLFLLSRGECGSGSRKGITEFTPGDSDLTHERYRRWSRAMDDQIARHGRAAIAGRRD